MAPVHWPGIDDSSDAYPLEQNRLTDIDSGTGVEPVYYSAVVL